MKNPLIITALILVTLGARANAQCTNQFILTSTTDFSTGSTSTLSLVDKTPTINLQSIDPDAVLRPGFDGMVYVVNRGAGNVEVLDPCQDFSFVIEFSVGAPTNPHDIIMYWPDFAYVSRYNAQSVMKVNPRTGAQVGSVINLGTLADADQIPEMDQMFFADGSGSPVYLCVLLQCLDKNNGYIPTGKSNIAVIDPATDTVVDMDPGTGGVQGVPLIRQNPYSEVAYRVDGGVGIAYFSCVGYFGVLDAGVVAVELDDLASQRVIISESAAGGDILDVEIISDTKGFAIIATPAFVNELIAFNPTTGTKIGASMYAPGDYILNDCEPSPLGLLLTDRKPTDPGIRCFDMATNLQIPGGPVDVGLPPFDILVNDGSPTGAGDTPSAATHLGPNYPNPFNPSTSIPFTLARAGRVTLRVYDVSGRVVATLVDGVTAAGEHVTHWDGRDARGLRASSGVYLARLDVDGTIDTRKLVLLK